MVSEGRIFSSTEQSKGSVFIFSMVVLLFTEGGLNYFGGATFFTIQRVGVLEHLGCTPEIVLEVCACLLLAIFMIILHGQKVNVKGKRTVTPSSVEKLESDLSNFHLEIQALLRERDMVGAENCLARMHSAGCTTNARTLNLFMEACPASDILGTERWFVQMLERDELPAAACCDKLIQVHARHNDVVKASDLMNRMIAQNIMPTTKSFKIMVTLCAQCCDLDGAILWTAKYSSYWPATKVNCCTEIVNSWARAGSLKESLLWLEKMVAVDVEPNQDTCTALLKSCAKVGDIANAERWFNVMSDRGLLPKAVGVTAVIGSCIKSNRQPEARVWCARLEECDILDPSVYLSVLSAYAKLGDIAKASMHIERMEARGVVPDICAHNSMLQACAKAGDLAMMGLWLERMEQRGLMCDVYVCNTVMNAYALAGDVKRSMHIFNRMRSQGVPPDNVSYAIVAKAHAAVGDVATVERLIEEMLSEGLQMCDHHLCAILSAYSNVRPWQPEKAEAAFYRGLALGAEVSRPVVMALARAVGWSRCNHIVGSRERRRKTAQPH